MTVPGVSNGMVNIRDELGLFTVNVVYLELNKVGDESTGNAAEEAGNPVEKLHPTSIIQIGVFLHEAIQFKVAKPRNNTADSTQSHGKGRLHYHANSTILR